MDLHTDGTYVKEVTDWLLMTKIEEKNVKGGETTMLHLDDWEHANELFQEIMKLKPAAAKGVYVKSVFMSSTMSPSIQIDAKTIDNA